MNRKDQIFTKTSPILTLLTTIRCSKCCKCYIFCTFYLSFLLKNKYFSKKMPPSNEPPFQMVMKRRKMA